MLSFEKHINITMRLCVVRVRRICLIKSDSLWLPCYAPTNLYSCVCVCICICCIDGHCNNMLHPYSLDDPISPCNNVFHPVTT